MPRRSKRGGCNCNYKQSNKIRKTKNLDKNKQYKSLQTRLMQISLTADAYIYQAKKISTEKAREYLLEVSTYKDQCRDMRALQVIEKLTSIMTMIIQEGTTSQTNDDPVKILEEKEDPLASNQCAQNDYSMIEVPQAISPIIQCKSQPHVVKHNYKIDLTKEVNNNADNVFIDLTENEFFRPVDLIEPHDDINPKHPKTPDKSYGLTKALSNLSLDDIERQQGVNLDQDINSQSILDDIEVQIITNTINKNVKNNQNDNDYSKVQCDNVNVQSQSILEDNEINDIKKSIDKNFVGSQINNTINKPRTDNNMNTNDMVGCSNIQNIINQTKEYRSTAQILPKNIRKPKARKYISEKAKPKRSYNRKANASRSHINVSTNIESVVLENTNSLKNNPNNTSVNNAKARKARTNKKGIIGKRSICKHFDTNIDITATNIVTNNEMTNTGIYTNCCTNNNTSNIEDSTENEYTNNTATNTNVFVKINNVKSNEEDLSWIENIKYIRVVEKAEFCHLEGITDSFWDNVCYPGDFDENDYKF